MDENERLSPHETAQVLHGQLTTLMRERGLSAEKAVEMVNEAARRAGLDVRVSIADAPRPG